MSKKPRLGVNIDHVATLRQARGETYPSIVDAANISLSNGADQITIHLREDRRHIQDTDVEAVRLVTRKYGKPLNLEMGCNQEIIDIALATNPDWVCLVPENRQERTTEGGLNLIDDKVRKKVQKTCEAIKEKLPETKISLFLEANITVLEHAVKMPIEAVEIHTGDYAKAHLNGEDFSSYLSEFKSAEQFLKENETACHAGHGLTFESLSPLLDLKLFEEYNVGHWVICQAIFDGLGSVVSKLNEQFEGSNL
ncbi:MAG: pyridoxine 5'-phosphate synthase [Bacteriovoracaceae bacterium]|nr:pyridoxine 5'-phosphate synthase [Bacteriovoracaceae bacterium]